MDTTRYLIMVQLKIEHTIYKFTYTWLPSRLKIDTSWRKTSVCTNRWETAVYTNRRETWVYMNRQLTPWQKFYLTS